MTNRIIEITVGIFVLLGALALMILAIQVSGLTDVYTGEAGYKVTADFENIGGLKVRGKVTLNGVQVGRVVKIALNEDKTPSGTMFVARVTMMINKKVSDIPVDVKANILTAGLLGDNYVGLEPGFSTSNLPADGQAHIALENTRSAVILENLISSLVSSKASGTEQE